MAEAPKIHIRRVVLTGFSPQQGRLAGARLRQALVEGLSAQGAAPPDALAARVARIVAEAAAPPGANKRKGP
jgi:hypothetical protein